MRRNAGRRVVTLAIGCVAGLAALFLVRAVVAETFYVPTQVVAPEVPVGARVLVYKLDRSYAPGDIVAYRTSGCVHLARVAAIGPAGALTVTRNGPSEGPLDPAAVIGRVVLTTR